jgi:hypothetical protein
LTFIRRAQRNDRTYRAPFLTDARMRRTMHKAFSGQFQHGLLEGADQVQLAEHRAPATQGRPASSRHRWN